MVINADVANFISPNTKWPSHLKLFDSGASIDIPIKLQYVSTTKASILSRLVRAHTYINNNYCGFWYSNHFGP